MVELQLQFKQKYLLPENEKKYEVKFLNFCIYKMYKFVNVN
jgi:hypothetical protein